MIMFVAKYWRWPLVLAAIILIATQVDAVKKNRRRLSRSNKPVAKQRNQHSEDGKPEVRGVAGKVPGVDVVDPDNQDNSWPGYKNKFNKHFNDQDEDNYRKTVFEKNVKYINEHNKEAERGLHSFTLGINNYTDLTTEEVNSLLTLRAPAGNSKPAQQTAINDSQLNLQALPATVDWRSMGIVTAVKDQGNCGSCWAFSAIGSLESQWAKKTKQLVSLSEQNLVDCSYGNYGCQCGWVDAAFKFIQQNGGIERSEAYPYTALTETCKYSPVEANFGANCTGYINILTGSESALQTAVANVGPVSVAIDASLISFHLYKSGVYFARKKSCSTTKLNHAVLAVGYGTTRAGLDYWLVKNSWGPSWGDGGYILMSRNKNNQCGIATDACYPTV